jgi:hypothetical protein
VGDSAKGVAAADASAEGGDAMLPDVAAGKADHERIQDWLDVKFEEWTADAEAQIEAQEAAHSRPGELGGQ